MTKRSRHQPSVEMEVHSECKHLTKEEKQRIVDLKSMFASMRTLWQALEAVDSGCQNGHYTCKATGVDLAGYPLMCTIAGCESKLTTFRAAAPHYPVLRTLRTRAFLTTSSLPALTLLSELANLRHLHCCVTFMTTGSCLAVTSQAKPLLLGLQLTSKSQICQTLSLNCALSMPT